MFTAMILACALNPDGSTDWNVCMGFTSPYIWPNVETCVDALRMGIPAVEGQGWAIQDYECYDWKASKGTKL